MSCHNIGEGMNYVVATCLEAYDNGHMDLEAARSIIRACQEGTGYCDGNGYEAIACCSDYRCGGCLKVLPDGTPLYAVYDLGWNRSSKLPNLNKVYDYLAAHAAYNHLCHDCFMRLMTEAFGSKELALTAKDILEAMPPNRWHAKKPFMLKK